MSTGPAERAAATRRRPGRFAVAAYPRGALVDSGAPEPGRHLVAMVDALLRCSLPAAGRLGRVRAPVVRRGLLPRALGAALAVAPSRPQPDLERLRSALEGEWPALAARLDRLPPAAPDLSLLALRRSFGRLVLVFGGQPSPLLVCKTATGAAPRLAEEAAVLASLAGFPGAPRHLGRVGEAEVQEALPGQPLHLEPLRPRDAARAGWSAELAEAAEVLAALGRATRGPAEPVGLLSPAAEALLPAGAVRRVRGCLERVQRLGVTVLRHADVGPQNLLVSARRVTGLVDWELARRGLPGADVLQLLVSVFEQRLGLFAWDEAAVGRAFAQAWPAAPLFVDGRAAAAAAAGVAPDVAGDLEVAFFAARLQERVDEPGGFLVSPGLAADMLARVAGG